MRSWSFPLVHPHPRRSSPAWSRCPDRLQCRGILLRIRQGPSLTHLSSAALAAPSPSSAARSASLTSESSGVPSRNCSTHARTSAFPYLRWSSGSCVSRRPRRTWRRASGHSSGSRCARVSRAYYAFLRRTGPSSTWNSMMHDSTSRRKKDIGGWMRILSLRTTQDGGRTRYDTFRGVPAVSCVQNYREVHVTLQV